MTPIKETRRDKSGKIFEIIYTVAYEYKEGNSLKKDSDAGWRRVSKIISARVVEEFPAVGPSRAGN
jgi:hypothetical protein